MKAPAKKNSSVYFSNPFSKGLRILNFFKPEHNSLSLKEIAQALNTDSSSAFRFCNTLVELNYLNKDPRTKLLSPGPKAYVLGLNLVKSFSLRQLIAPLIDEVYTKHGMTIDSAILEGDVLVQVYYRAAKDALVYQLPIVASAIHCSSIGKSILAFLPGDETLALIERLEFIKRTDRSVTDKDAFLRELEKTRIRGYATNNEEYIPGQIVIGAPFFNLETGRPAGGVSFDFSVIQNTMERIEKTYKDILLKLAKDISAVIR